MKLSLFFLTADDDELVKQKIFFKRERHNWAWSINTLAHVMASLGFNTDGMYKLCGRKYVSISTLYKLLSFSII